MRAGERLERGDKGTGLLSPETRARPRAAALRWDYSPQRLSLGGWRGLAELISLANYEDEGEDGQWSLTKSLQDEGMGQWALTDPTPQLCRGISAPG